MHLKLLLQLTKWTKCYILGTDLKAILSGTDHARKAIIKRATHEGYLERLKRDIYLIRNIPNKPKINMFELAEFIYGPSYISFESALSYYGWIPERVTVICSATIKQARTFNPSIGEFSFEKIPKKAFSLGVTYKQEEKSSFLLADPWKAIADIMYCRKKTWATINDLMLDLRIEENDIKNHNLNLLKELCHTYPHQSVRRTLNAFLKGLTE